MFDPDEDVVEGTRVDCVYLPYTNSGSSVSPACQDDTYHSPRTIPYFIVIYTFVLVKHKYGRISAS